MTVRPEVRRMACPSLTCAEISTSASIALYIVLARILLADSDRIRQRFVFVFRSYVHRVAVTSQQRLSCVNYLPADYSSGAFYRFCLVSHTRLHTSCGHPRRSRCVLGIYDFGILCGRCILLFHQRKHLAQCSSFAFSDMIAVHHR
jgi:hypothetical protein